MPFKHQGDTNQRDLIMSFLDSGYVHRNCVVKALQPYNGPEAKPIEVRINEALAGESAAINEYVMRAHSGAVDDAAYELTKAAPGSGKTKVHMRLRCGLRRHSQSSCDTRCVFRSLALHLSTSRKISTGRLQSRSSGSVLLFGAHFWILGAGEYRG